MKIITVLEVIGLLLVFLLVEVIAMPLRLIVWVLRNVVRSLDWASGRLL
ncbi:hypothetical protein LJR296_001434 [Cupriavidus necator]